MAESYLPKLATTAEACQWLSSQGLGDWTLSRLLDCGLMPWFWMDYAPGWEVIFKGRHEGYLAPIVFMGDCIRLEASRDDTALVTMTRTAAGDLMRMQEGMKVPLSDLRFKREDLQDVAKRLSTKGVGDAKPLAEREKKAMLTLIGAMLELLLSPKPGRDTNAAVIEELLANYSDKEGISQRTIENRFAAAAKLFRD